VADQVAIITGAGGGIGRAIAAELDRLGFALALVGRSESTLQETARLCKETLAHLADVTDPTSLDGMIAATLQRYGRIDAVINNAGYAPLLRMEQISVEEWKKILDTNLSSVFYLCRAVWPIFIKHGGGVIVNISSESARDPFIGLGAYGAAKAGVNLLGRALAQEGAQSAIRVHTIAPGAVETEMLRGVVTKEQYPTEKTLTPAEVARVVAQCVAGDLRHTSGEVIYVHKTVA